MVDAKKQTHGETEAMKVGRQAQQIYSAKGKKVLHLVVKSAASDDEIKKLLLGPTGNLRAPTLRIGKTLLVGFNSDMYEEAFSD